jgi:uncharacterized SAM-dependent methyltransferase
MNIKERLFKELVRKGYSKCKEGRSVWDISNRSFLYMTDELAKKFLEFRNFPRYKRTIVDIETSLLENNSDKIKEGVEGGSFNLIDMGCGDGSKAKVFIRKVCNDCNVRFCPVNIGEYLVNLALENVRGEGFESVKDYQPQVADLDSIGDVANMMRNHDYPKNVILLLGSILASFDIHDYLFKLSQAMMSGDRLIIGNAIRKGDRFVNLEVYKHSVFDDWLRPLIRGLGFEDEEVEYDARFENGRVEGFFKVKKEKEIQHGAKTIKFDVGDEIVAAVLYKYYEHELLDYCKMYFRDVEVFVDSEKEYGLFFCKK